MKKQCQNCKFLHVASVDEQLGTSGRCTWSAEYVPYIVNSHRTVYNLDKSDQWTFSCPTFEPKDN